MAFTLRQQPVRNLAVVALRFLIRALAGTTNSDTAKATDTTPRTSCSN